MSSSSRASTVSADEEKQKPTDTIPGEKWKPTRAFYVAFTALFVITLAASLTSTSLSIALPTIAKKLTLTNVEAFWLGTSTAITSTVIQPGCAPLADAVGRKAALSTAVAFLTIGSLLGTLATNGFVLMVVARCIQGLGIGAVTAVTEIIVTEVVPLRLRGKWLALISVAWAAGTVSGPLQGGLLAEATDWSWRLIFALIIPICILGLILCIFTLELPRRPASAEGGQTKAARQGLAEMDWIGFALFTASIVAILVPVTQARVVYPWSDYRTVVPLSLGCAGIVLFSLYEIFVASNPMLPFAGIFTDRSCVATFAGTALHGLVLWCLLYYVPLYYEAVQGFTPIQAGVAMLPETASLVPASVVTGLLITWTGAYRWAIWGGWAITTAGMGCLAFFLSVGTPTAQWVGLNLVVGLGTGMLFGAMGFAVQASVSSDHLAVAVTLFSFFRSLGAAVGVAVGGAIFQNELEARLLPARIILGGVAGSEGSNSLTLISGLQNMPDSPQKSVLVTAIAESLQKVWVAMCITSGVALVLCLCIRHFSLDVDLVGEASNRRSQKEEEEAII
ncbi:major facilitator superfamily domain-containing protein [Podospora didyma]|uniref:Major facilitator superfamily domain-containing protein n=1 Tax=Podospora didyma TaxID=330526 RepID=A0AAE0K9E3_9PEZI|nr:major facilitator superfamily domain-containing protein [Podospora didyma]